MDNRQRARGRKEKRKRAIHFPNKQFRIAEKLVDDARLPLRHCIDALLPLLQPSLKLPTPPALRSVRARRSRSRGVPRLLHLLLHQVPVSPALRGRGGCCGHGLLQLLLLQDVLKVLLPMLLGLCETNLLLLLL
jgi:hypothetical protein